jgi:hypothetical protein
MRHLPSIIHTRLEFIYSLITSILLLVNRLTCISKLHWNNTFCSPFEDGWTKTPLMGLMNYHPTIKNEPNDGCKVIFDL